MALKHRLGFIEIFCIATGAMISSGLFLLPREAFGLAGPAMVAAYALAGVMVIPGIFASAELATAMPRSGGSYMFIERSMGGLAGTLAGLSNWWSLALKSAYAMIGIGAFSEILGLPGGEWAIKLIAVGGCVFFALLNIFSVKSTGRLQVIFVVLLLGAIGYFVLFGAPAVAPHRLENFWGCGVGSVFAASGMVFISFGGLTKVVSVAEEVKNPRKIPLAMFSALTLVGFLYVACVFITVGVLSPEALRDSYTPLSAAAREFGGRFGEWALALAGLLAFVTTGNSGILAASRDPMAMSRDGLLPKPFSHISRFGTPYVSIILTASFMCVMILALPLHELVIVASTMMLIVFLMVNIAVLIMRGSKLQNYRPTFRSPLFPWLQIAAILIYGALIVELTIRDPESRVGFVPVVTAVAFFGAGTLWYLLYVRRRNPRESALVVWVRKALAKEMSRSRLDAELHELATHRDHIIHDRFDELLKECPVLDLEGTPRRDEFFRAAAEAMADRLAMSADDLFDRFRQREEESSTILQPGLAVPHIIIPGEGKFDLLLARSRRGIIFDPDKPHVQVVFLLVGTVDERNYHLRALMAIAQIVQEDDFMRRWREAPAPEYLRDLLLLSRRPRDEE